MTTLAKDKECIQCLEVKPLTEFTKRSRGKDGLHYYCRLCQSNNRYRTGRNEALYARRLEVRYGITVLDYNRMFQEQSGTCGICKKAETRKDKFGRIKVLNVDHCHSTGKVRGLLCSNCNTALGLFEDSLERLDSAKGYLIDKR